MAKIKFTLPPGTETWYMHINPGETEPSAQFFVKDGDVVEDEKCIQNLAHYLNTGRAVRVSDAPPAAVKP